MLQKWNKAEKKIQKDASKIFSFGEFNVRSEINLLKANKRKKLDNTILQFSKIQETLKQKLKTKEWHNYRFWSGHSLKK